MVDHSENVIGDTAQYPHSNDAGHNYCEDLGTPLLIDKNGPKSKTSCLIAQQSFQRTADPHSIIAARKLKAAIFLCFFFMLTEIVGGHIAGSLAIMADAAHLLSDCVSFIVALLAIWFSRKSPDHKMTFGYKRIEVLGAIISIIGIWLLTTILCYVSVNRLIENDFDIDSPTMMIISGIGIVINIVMAFILHGACSMPHTHSHSHGSVKKSNKYERIVSNQIPNERYFETSLQNAEILHQQQPTFLINGNKFPVRCDSICSYRSPGHSRSSSISKTMNLMSIGQGDDCSSVVHLDHLDGSVSIQPHPTSNETNQENTHHHRRYSESSDSYTDQTGVHNSDRQHKHNSNGSTIDKNINIQAAVIHVLGDFIQSIGIFIAAIVIYYYPNAKIVDPLCTFLFSIIVMCTTVKIMKTSVMVILDAVPTGFDVERLKTELNCLPGVRSVHDLNVWSVTVDWLVMSAHLVIDSQTNADKVLENATDMAREDFGIQHCTIQLERCHEQPLTDALHVHNHRPLDISDAMVNFV